MLAGKRMQERYPSLLSLTASGALALVRSTMPEAVMAAFEEEPRSDSTRPKAPPPVRAWNWLHHNLWPHRLTNMAVIVSIFVAGALVVLISSLNSMGYLGPRELILGNRTSSPPPSPPSSHTAHGSFFLPPPPHTQTSNLSLVDTLNPNASITAGSPPNATASTIPVPDTQIRNSSSTSRNSCPDCKVVPAATVPPPPVEESLPRVFYQNMSATWHHMSDEELLWTASMTPLRSSGGPPQPRRIAYMFVARGPLPFAPLWERYFRGHEKEYNIYIHAHPSFVPSFAPTSPFFGRFIPSQQVEWGRLSVYEAERRLLGNALLDHSNQWFALLSESCIPVDNFPATYRYLAEAQRSFIQSFEEPTRPHPGRLYRGMYKKMEPEITPNNFRKGSQWFQINRDLALAAVADTKYYGKFEKYFCHLHPVCYIDEHYLPTFASITRPDGIAYRTLTFFEFRRNGPHPTKWDEGNTNENLIKWVREGHNCTYNGKPTSKCHLFARKFDPNALDILLDLAGRVMGIP